MDYTHNKKLLLSPHMKQTVIKYILLLFVKIQTMLTQFILITKYLPLAQVDLSNGEVNFNRSYQTRNNFYHKTIFLVLEDQHEMMC